MAKKYMRDEAFALNRSEQMAILKVRKVLFNSKSNESELVDLIIKSNPNVVEKVLTTRPIKKVKVVDKSNWPTKVELEEEIKAWKGVNRYICGDAVNKLKRGLYK